LLAQWYVEAGEHNVLPIDGRAMQRFADERPQLAVDRTRYVYYPGTQEAPTNVAPKIFNRPHSITVDVEISQGGAEDVLVSQGGIDGGFSFFVKDGRLCYTYNYVARTFYHAKSNVAAPAGRHALRYEFEVTGQPEILKGKGAGGRGQLYIDGKPAGQVVMDVTSPLTLGLAAGVAVGADPGAPVTDEYAAPFPFTGTIFSVTYDVSGDLIRDSEAELRMMMARQKPRMRMRRDWRGMQSRTCASRAVVAGAPTRKLSAQ
jgi:arylsulfatase